MRNTILGLTILGLAGVLGFAAVAETAAPAAQKAEATAPAAAGNVGGDQTSFLVNAAGALEARQHLVRQGYINISDLMLDDRGRWSGTAVKDGKTVIVALDLRNVKPDAATN
jgi:hypothetical protein